MPPRFPFLRVLLAICLTIAGSRAAQTLVPVNATWRYLDTGANLGTAWRAPAFNDSSWNSGPAQLGFGDGDEATIVNGGPSNARYRTTYFRHSFVITDLPSLTNFAVRVLRDDGVVIYVNGAEALRQNMPEGVITANTLTPRAAGGAEESTFFTEPLAVDLFVPGTNVIAVELHQSDAASTDLSFALELLANTPAGNFPPVATIFLPDNGAVFAAGESFVVQATASDVDSGIQSVAILRNGLVVASGPGPSLTFTNGPLGSGTHYFVARALDAYGSISFSPTNGVSVRPPGKHLVHFPGFTVRTNLVLHRSSDVSSNRLVLNPASGGTGGAYLPAKQFIRDGFDVQFQYDIHDIVNSGGDGLSFIIQNNSPGLWDGTGAGSIGYGDIPNSIAVEFDTWGNPEATDPNSNHIGVHTRGTLPNSSDETNALGVVTGIASLNGVHTVRILYAPPVLSVFLDNTNTPVLNVTNDLSTLFPLDFGRAWMGFGSGTGAGIEGHDILSWSITTPEWISTRIVAPATLAILNAPVSFSVEATATAFTGSVTRVEFYDDGVWFGESFAPPYRATWNTTRLGSHQLVAVAYDSAGHSTPSEPVPVYVQAGDGRTTLIPAGSAWHYHDGGVDLGAEWLVAEFNDSAWKLGEAEFGFGEDDEVTRVNSGGSTSRYPTTYFRRSFAVTNAAGISNLAVRLLRDDGAVVHLNGNEVLRSNMPLGPISFSTLALAAAQGTNETNFFVSGINPALLHDGMNTLAVEVHQSDASSSDLSFDLELVANSPLGNLPPTVKLTGITNAQVFGLNASFTVNVSAIDSDGTVAQLQVFLNGAQRTNTTAASASLAFNNLPFGIYTITARATDNAGLTGTLVPVTFLVTPPNADRFSITQFGATSPLTILDSAQYFSERLRLTRSGQLHAVGSGWWITPALVTNGFDALFSFRISGPTGNGADGFALVVAGRDAPVTGTQGGQIGYGGISNSLAVEFDTFSSSVSGAYHEVAVHSGGIGANTSDAAQRLAGTTSVPAFADQSEHTALVSYRPGSLRVFVDDLTTPELNVPVQLHTLLNLPHGTAWVGLTSATGGDTENHDIIAWHFAANSGPTTTLQRPTLLPNQAVQFSFFSLSGRTYQVQWSEDLVTWHDAGTALTGTGAVITWTDSGPPQTPTQPQFTPRRFFRAQILLP